MSSLSPGAVLEQLPLFPLPNVVLFPDTLLPLHVFEPRYLEMLEQALDGNQLIGVVQLAPGWESDYYGSPAIHDILGVGEVVRRMKVEGGRSDILLRGRARGRILSEHQTELAYRTASVELLPRGGDLEALEPHQLATIRQLLASSMNRIGDFQLDELDVLFENSSDPVTLLDLTASCLPFEGRHKQELLAEPSVQRRVDRLTQLLADLALGEPRETASRADEN